MTLTFPICRESDIGYARRNIAQAVNKVGFSRRPTAQIELAVTELARNLIKHKAKNGYLQATYLDVGTAKGFEIISNDQGPGIDNIEQALQDGYSTKGTYGDGLGTVKRTMDEFAIYSKTQAKTIQLNGMAKSNCGTLVVARKWLNSCPSQAKQGIKFGLASRPHPKERVNGDAAIIILEGKNALIAVFDALGHGQGAQEASKTAQNYLIAHSQDNLVDLVRGIHSLPAVKHRGLALALARLDLHRRKFTHIGVGNVQTRVVGSRTPIHPISRFGTVGFRLPRLVANEYPWSQGSVILMHSDGLSNYWRLLFDKLELTGQPLMLMAHGLVKSFGKIDDDATVLAVK